MKCDELKDYDYDPDFPFQSRGRFYVADEVEAAIAELQSKLEAKELEFANLKEDALNTDKAREKWLQLARNQAMEIRRLKRALYKACANWADVVAFEETEGIGHDNSVAERWRKMERKCRNKMEEYK